MMEQSSQVIVRRAYDAFATGDLDSVMALCADDITFHIPGSSPLSGDYAGKDEVLALFGRMAELSGGTLGVAVDELLGTGERVAVLTTVTAERIGRSVSLSNIHLLRVLDGRIAALREYQGDERSEDEFWSS